MGLNQVTLFSAGVLTPEGERGLEYLRKQCEACTRCSLHKHRTHVVFGEGDANEPSVCFVGEAPSGTDDAEGRPFVGKSGQVLTRMVSAMGLTRDNVYMCNVIKCRPEANRPPTAPEVAACSTYLLNQVRAVKPKVIVTLGATATNAILGGKKPLQDRRGKWAEYEGVPVMPTLHPSALARAESQPNYTDLKKMVWSDLQMVMHKLGLRKS